MHKSHLLRNDQLYQYLLSVSSREHEIQAALRRMTVEKVAQSQMMTSIEQGQFLGFLAELIGARRAIEVGVFTGYGSLAIARALPEDGVLIGCELNSEWPEMAKPFWQQAGVEHKIQLKLGPAVQTLEHLLNEGHANTFDFIFIDADKINYWEYYKLALQLVRTGGLIAVDNCLMTGNAFVFEENTEALRAIATFNQKIHLDERISLSLVPVGGGMLLARKK